MTISEMLALNATKYPNETALIEIRPSINRREAITWQEFDRRANRVANALRERGIGKDDKVIHLMMNSIDWLVVRSSSPSQYGSPLATVTGRRMTSPSSRLGSFSRMTGSKL